MDDNRNRVVYLTYDGLTDPLGQSQIMPYLGALGKKGFQITILSFEKQSRFLEHKQVVYEWCRKNQIRWMPLAYHKNPPVLSTLVDLARLWCSLQRLYNSQPFTLVHCRSYLVALIGLLARQRWKVKFLFDMRGFWPDERVEGGLWNLKNPVYRLIYRFFKNRERVLLANADHVISLTENARSVIAGWGFTVPITIIPTCVDTDLFNTDRIDQEAKALTRSKLQIAQDDFVLLYLGSWGTWYETNQMLQFFYSLRKRHPKSVFLIVTQDAVSPTHLFAPESFRITTASRTQVPLLISLAHAAVCFIKPSFSKRASSATKLGEIMAMGVPVVVNRGWGDVNALVPESLLLSEFSEVEFQRLLNHLLKHEFRSHQLTQSIVSLEQGVKRYEDIYRALLIEADSESKTS